MIFIGCWNALLMFFAFRTMLLAKTSARFLVKFHRPSHAAPKRLRNALSGIKTIGHRTLE